MLPHSSPCRRWALLSENLKILHNSINMINRALHVTVSFHASCQKGGGEDKGGMINSPFNPACVDSLSKNGELDSALQCNKLYALPLVEYNGHR